jgi:NAD(P)-dependent dehydrogenase (short-subunit alcohol dehydrogenase family)
MPAIDASELLRPGLLEGVSMMLASAPAALAGEGSLAGAVRVACAELGARVSECPLGSGESLGVEEADVEATVARVLPEAGRIDLLVLDAAGLFAAGVGANDGGSGAARAALGGCLDASWSVTRALVNRAFLPGARGGRIVYIAPPPDAGEHADAARAGLENLARTLSIEWARHAITAVTIAPGAGAGNAGSPLTLADEVAAMSAYLASPAGAYFSGCLLDLGGVGGR